ncbi:MAG: thiol reductant ABC exporter subunit CydD [Balneolaceae bacterium]|nr:thiol reductant ABC exporter subunit CydD [Balneolaceae bacterium]
MRSVHPEKAEQAQQRLFQDALSERGVIAGIAIAAILTGVAILVQMYSLSVLIDAAFLKEWSADAYYPFFFLLLGAVFIRAALAWLDKWLGLKLAIGKKSEYRRRLLHKIHDLGPVRLKKEMTGELIGVQLNGVEKLDDFFSQYVPAAIRMMTIPLIIFGAAMWFDWPTGLVFMITGPLIPIFMYLIGTKAGDKIREQWSSFRRLNAHFLDTIQGMDTLKLFGREKNASRSINNVSRMFRVTTMRVLKVAFLSGMVLELSASVSTAVVAVEIGVRLIEGMIGFQMGLFMLLLAPEFYLPFRNFGSAHHAGMEGAEAGTRLFDLLDEKTDQNSKEADENFEIPPPPFNIGLIGLRFNYPNSANEVLKGVNLTLRPGEVHTLTGASGEGKTTILNLIGKLLRAEHGDIIVNGTSLIELNIEKWRGQISFLPQFPHFITGNIADNIRLGNHQATDSEIIDAADGALAHEFITKLPDGYNTILGEGGLNLSGGERQRIALARVFLKKSPILLLDEPASFLNEELELLLLKSIKKLSENRIVLLSSHQPRTILASDRLSILSNGKISESGSPDELFPDFWTEIDTRKVK